MRFSRDLDRHTFLKLGAAGTAVAAINPSIGGASVGAKRPTGCAIFSTFPWR
jgi:hypothetical protein